MKTLQEALHNILAFRDEREWAQFHSPKNLAAALSIEASELLELFLWKADEEVSLFLEQEVGKKNTQREIADILIYALLICHETGIDPLLAIQMKLAENEEKYPVHLARGRSEKYTELPR